MKIYLKRGSSAKVATYTGPARELVVDTGKKTLVVQDGSTIGGIPQAPLSSVPTALSKLTDDVGLWTKSALSKVSELSDDVGYWKSFELTKTSQLTNDKGYLTGHCSYCSYCTYCSNCGRCNSVQCNQVRCTQVRCSQCSGECNNCSNCSNCQQCDCCDN